jgi:CHASE3 domain sensor protein
MNPMLPHRTLAGQLSAAFKLFGGLVAAASLVTALAYGIGWFWLTPELEQSRVSVKTEGAAHSAMLDQENGIRGYLLAHDASFLQPYTAARVALAHANQALAASVGSVPEIGIAMLATRLAQERWIERWAKPAVASRPDAARVSMSDGKMLFDAYRTEEAMLADALERQGEALFRPSTSATS